MGRSVSRRLTSFCLNRAAVATRVITRSPRARSKTLSAMVEAGPKSSTDAETNSSTGAKLGTVLSRRIMVLVDSKPEAKGALQWALSHAVQSHDTVVLLDVVKLKHGNQSQNELNPRRHELLYAMKNICQARRPEVKVELSLAEGKERGPTIVEEARKQEVSLLVLGQRKRSATWRLVMMWAGNRVRGGGVVDYCIQNASCMALAVRRKSRRAGGGYLITSRRHKDFWLLA
ncbi:uncharacterized protein LOC103717930 [Phoenix dactylifera]|uniref:Uncharacterized protein LOC103717930 n=1 Tax=Phoenix dactylifera TaxID=42345 RepID=A0A8B7CRJ0_PHODC|nr:uncharacterized protein LOC103717930 [Phoenix dactylifera]